MNNADAEKLLKIQTERVRELEELLALSEKQIELQEELIADLQKANEMHQRHAEDYASLLRQILDGQE